jgi:hypothetical protein
MQYVDIYQYYSHIINVLRKGVKHDNTVTLFTAWQLRKKRSCA